MDLVLVIRDIVAGEAEKRPEVLEGHVGCLAHAGEAGADLLDHGLPVLQQRRDLQQLVGVTAVLRPAGGGNRQ